MIVKLPSGRDELTVDLRRLRVCHLRPSVPSTGDAGALVAAAVEQPVDGPPLDRLAAARGSAAVVVPDWTRAIELPAVLPPILERIHGAGVEPAATTVVVACGTHPHRPEDEVRELLGPVPEGVRVVQHDARDGDTLVTVGALDDGTPVRLRREVVEAGVVVTVAGVLHHYFAGFGGGPKMIFPGVAGLEEIQRNHARVLERAADGLRRHPGCDPGVLAGNPVAAEIRSTARLRTPDLEVALVTAPGGGVAWAGAGRPYVAWEAGIERVRSWYELPPRRFPFVVAAAGGAPVDRSLIQAHKALDAAARWVEDGGEILFVASLDRGFGSPAAEPFLADPEPSSVLARLAEEYVQYGHTVLRIVDKTRRYTIHLCSGLDEELARRLGFRPTDDAAAVVADWRERSAGAAVGVMAGSPVYPRRDGPDAPAA